MKAKLFFFYFLTTALSSCLLLKKSEVININRLEFAGEYDVPHKMNFKGTTIGGLSGIDYNKKANVYYVISDDRSAIDPARFYTIKIKFSEKGFDSLEFTGVHYLLGPDGSIYPNSNQDPAHTPDPESIRYNPLKNELVWSSEGERITGSKKMVIEDPAITIIDTTGRYKDTFTLPDNMHMHTTEKGPRQNGVFEGLAFSEDYKSLFVSVEEPIYEDGPRAGLNDSTGWIRIIKYNARSHKPVAEYAYQIDAVAFPPTPANGFKINGIPDILWLGKNRLLVTERSFSTGRPGCVIKLYIADLNGATDVKDIRSVRDNPAVKPVSKKLLLNMDSLGIYIDNIEGATLGPTLPDGQRLLVFVADDNFARDEKTQFLLFKIK